jgi:hypothetical protein
VKKTEDNIEHRKQLHLNKMIHYLQVSRSNPIERMNKYSIPFMQKLLDDLKTICEGKDLK